MRAVRLSYTKSICRCSWSLWATPIGRRHRRSVSHGRECPNRVQINVDYSGNALSRILLPFKSSNIISFDIASSKAPSVLPLFRRFACSTIYIYGCRPGKLASRSLRITESNGYNSTDGRWISKPVVQRGLAHRVLSIQNDSAYCYCGHTSAARADAIGNRVWRQEKQ